MKTIEEEIQIIKQNLKGIKNEEIRSKAMFMIRALQSGNISLSIDKFGCSGRKFYFWLNRLRKANYDIKALANRSRAPKSNSRTIPEETIQLAIKVSSQNYNS